MAAEKRDMNGEEWRPVVGFENVYMVSNYGNVKGVIRSGSTGNILKPSTNGSGYLSVGLYNHPYHRTCTVHRLVAMAFIPNPENKRTVNHIDGNKRNNRADNLEWATHGENHRHAYRTGLKVTTERQRAAVSATGKRTCEMNRMKTPVFMINKDGLKTRFVSAHEAARFVKGDPSPIIRCCKGKKKTYKGCTWEYAGKEEKRQLQQK